eukprot:Hpha_TRINITY_DN28234_c0_g1::TRINITY_DN28234_c0_g1_i1::g.116760::m.116760
MGRSKMNPHLSRKQNRERRENLKYSRSKKVRSELKAKKNMEEGNMQQQVVPHKKALLTARMLQLKRQRQEAEEATRMPDTFAAPPAKRRRGETSEPEPAAPPASFPPPAPERGRCPTGVKATRMVVAAPGCMIRVGEDLGSAPVRRLTRDSILWVAEVRGRRGRIVSPEEGWVSVRDSEGAVICDEAPEGESDGEWDGDGKGTVGEGVDDDEESVDTEDIDIDDLFDEGDGGGSRGKARRGSKKAPPKKVPPKRKGKGRK